MTTFLVLALLLGALSAAAAGPVNFAHFHIGLLFGVVIAWWRWRRKPHP